MRPRPYGCRPVPFAARRLPRPSRGRPDPEREAEQIHRLRALAEESNLDPEFAEKVLGFIVAEVVRHHERIAGSG